MSILIKGMEFPRDGEMLCINIYPDGKVCINLDLDCRQIATAVPVPPHGRVIEAEPIMKFITDGLNSGEFGYDQIKVLAEIQHAPTIIPAEEAPAEEAKVPAKPYDLLYEEGGLGIR